jgi:glutamate carboxypeptidase
MVLRTAPAETTLLRVTPSSPAPEAHAVAPLALRDVTERREEMLEQLRRLVELETPSDDPKRLRTAADWLAAWFSELGTTELVQTQREAAPHVLVEVGPPNGAIAPLVLCHYDTVWPAGTVTRIPFAVEGDAARGPGVLDMKASIVLVHHALRVLVGRGVHVRVLVTADEEIANPTSQELIADLAGRSSCALVMEPPLSDGRLKTARRGYARVRIRTDGRAAHAGIEPAAGVNAAVEAAHIAAFADALGARTPGASATVGLLRAGDRINVVPAAGEVGIDVRADSARALREILDELRSLRPCVAGARVAMNVEVERAPMLRLPDTVELLARARRVGASLGLRIAEGSTGGVSEGNLTQAAGVPTLDGLGVVGVGPHTPAERIRISSLLERTALHAGLLAELSSPR